MVYKRRPKLGKEWLRGPALDILLQNRALKSGDRVWEYNRRLRCYHGPTSVWEAAYCMDGWLDPEENWRLYAWKRVTTKPTTG